MRTLISLLPALMLIVSLSGCQTRKLALDSSIESEGLHQQALLALEQQKFIIEANEFVFPSVSSPAKMSSGSYISMQDSKATISFTPDVFPGSPWSYLKIEDNAAGIEKKDSKKNGDLLFSMKMDGGKPWLRRVILITLYPNTNKCFVQVNEQTGANVVNIKGVVYPKTDE